MTITGRKYRSWILALLSVLFILVLYYKQTPFLEAFEAKTYDLRFKVLRGPVTPDPGIAIIAIDEKSIAELGRFPWSRTLYVELLDKLTAAGARAVLFDAFFPDSEDREIDLKFAEALRRAGNVTLPVVFELNPDLTVAAMTGNLPELSAVASSLAHINILPEEDGVNRRSPAVFWYEGRYYPSLGLQGAMAGLNADKFTIGSFAITVRDRKIPVDEANLMWINFAGGTGLYQRYSFADIINNRIDPSELQDKILFLGSTALGIYDMRVTPFDGNTPGVEIHAAIADNIINGNFISQTGIEALQDMLFIIVLGLLAFFTTLKFRPVMVISFLAILAGGYFWLAYLLFLQGQWINMIYPLASIILAYITAGGYRFLVLDRHSREMRTIFSSYVSGRIVDQLVNNPDAAKIGGETREVTVLFSDIEGFTAYSETHDPYQVVSILNEYLAAMTQVIMDNEGTVDKFLGDGIMAFWGAPLVQEDHALLAMKCALAMDRTMLNLRKKWRDTQTAPLSFRLGIHSGSAIAGNIGAQGKKMEYTLIGDTVNLAARLEGTAKYYAIDKLVSENTYQLTREHFVFRELDRVRVLGRLTPITVYELLCARNDENAGACLAFAGKYEEALGYYRQRRWELAVQAFSALVAGNPEDYPSQLFMERCQYFQQNAPPPDWDGTFDRRTK